MSNERLRAAMMSAQIDVDKLAAEVGIDRKTVERWLSSDRVPHRTHRWTAAQALQVDETYLWPKARRAQTSTSSQAELVDVYPNRGAVPPALWRSLIDSATEQVDLLAYAALFLPDSFPDLARTLRAKAETGAVVRIALGDPDSDVVRIRGDEEGIGADLAARIRMSVSYLTGLEGVEGAEVRFHETTLYNSIYRFDQDLLVNTHAYGAPAAHSPVLHIRKLQGGHLHDHYVESFERVWSSAEPAHSRRAA